MSQMNEANDDEIDLFSFFQTLWDGKMIIGTCLLLATMIGSVLIYTKNNVYESKLAFSVDTIPPFYQPKDVLNDFKKKFYSKSVFANWKQNNSNTLIVFDDFSATKVVDGFVMSKSQSELLARLSSDSKSRLSSDSKFSEFIFLKSNQLPILDEFFKYAYHVNELLKSEYVFRAIQELKIIKSRMEDLGSADGKMVATELSIDRYIATAQKGENVLAIQRPTVPYKISPKPYLILSMSALFGFTIGVLYILIFNLMKKRKEQLVKA